jgi:hypothetical protein
MKNPGKIIIGLKRTYRYLGGRTRQSFQGSVLVASGNRVLPEESKKCALFLNNLNCKVQ